MHHLAGHVQVQVQAFCSASQSCHGLLADLLTPEACRQLRQHPWQLWQLCGRCRCQPRQRRCRRNVHVAARFCPAAGCALAGHLQVHIHAWCGEPCAVPCRLICSPLTLSGSYETDSGGYGSYGDYSGAAPAAGLALAPAGAMYAVQHAHARLLATCWQGMCH